MPQTLQLLDRALAQHTASEWARTFNISPSTFTNARKRGRLSPTLAGNLARQLHEDAVRWTAIAAIEAEPESPMKDTLLQTLSNIKKL